MVGEGVPPQEVCERQCRQGVILALLFIRSLKASIRPAAPPVGAPGAELIAVGNRVTNGSGSG